MPTPLQREQYNFIFLTIVKREKGLGQYLDNLAAADVDINDYSSIRPYLKVSLLILACEQNPEAALDLLERGADVNDRYTNVKTGQVAIAIISALQSKYRNPELIKGILMKMNTKSIKELPPEYFQESLVQQHLALEQRMFFTFDNSLKVIMEDFNCILAKNIMRAIEQLQNMDCVLNWENVIICAMDDIRKWHNELCANLHCKKLTPLKELCTRYPNLFPRDAFELLKVFEEQCLRADKDLVGDMLERVIGSQTALLPVDMQTFNSYKNRNV